MADDFCILHGYEHMKTQWGNPIPYCEACDEGRSLISEREMDWELIQTAPKDGTTIEVKNEVMDGPVLAKYGDYRSPWGAPSKQFILVKDFDRFMPLPPGTLVIPTHWRPYQPA